MSDPSLFPTLLFTVIRCVRRSRAQLRALTVHTLQQVTLPLIPHFAHKLQSFCRATRQKKKVAGRQASKAAHEIACSI